MHQAEYTTQKALCWWFEKEKESKKNAHISRSLTVPNELFYHGMQIC